MSKHRRDYTKPETAHTEPETVVDEPVCESVEAVTYGAVVNCSRLNVRANPSKNADVVRIANAGETVQIDLTNSTDEWYKIDDGYCMRQYIREV